MLTANCVNSKDKVVDSTLLEDVVTSNAGLK